MYLIPHITLNTGHSPLPHFRTITPGPHSNFNHNTLLGKELATEYIRLEVIKFFFILNNFSK